MDDMSELSYSAPHIAKNNKKIESVRRRQSVSMDDMSESQTEKASNYGGYPSSAMSTVSSAPLSPKGAAQGVNPYDQSSDAERAKVAALLDNHQKNVNAQVDECRQFVMHSMDKIMNVLEQRLTDGNHAQPAHHPQTAHS